MRVMQQMEIHSCPELMAEDMVDDDCRYVVFPDGGWDWPLWKWKGPIVTEGNCVYGKFFAGKAGFVSRAWWPDLCNYRRSQHPIPQEGSIEDAILFTLNEQGSMITRELRAACGFNGPKMRSRFDAYITRLQMACRRILSILRIDMDMNMAGAGRCSPHQSVCLGARLVSVLVHLRNHSSVCWLT